MDADAAAIEDDAYEHPSWRNITPEILAGLDRREAAISASRERGLGIPWEQAIDEVFGPDSHD